MKIHNVFHPNLLQKALTDPLTNQINEPPSPVIINNKKKLKLEDIFDTRCHWDKFQYCVKQFGYNENKEQYDAAGFKNSLEIVKDFYSRYLGKPRSRKPAVQKSRKKRN